MNEIKLRANLPISLDITTRFLAFFVEKISRRVNLESTCKFKIKLFFWRTLLLVFQT